MTREEAAAHLIQYHVEFWGLGTSVAGVNLDAANCPDDPQPSDPLILSQPDYRHVIETLAVALGVAVPSAARS